MVMTDFLTLALRYFFQHILLSNRRLNYFLVWTIELCRNIECVLRSRFARFYVGDSTL